MNEIICYTFDEYENKYPEMLKTYLDSYVDNTDLQFWNIQKEFYKKCLINVTLKPTNKGFDKLVAPFEPVSISIEKIHLDINNEMFVVNEKNVKHSVTIENKIKYDNRYKSFNKILEFIENQISETEQMPIQLHPLQQLNWQGTTLQFAEFSKALIESGFIGKIKNEKKVFDKMKQFFNVEDFNKSDKLSQVRYRTKDLTPVITVLEVALTNWIKHKD